MGLEVFIEEVRDWEQRLEMKTLQKIKAVGTFISGTCGPIHGLVFFLIKVPMKTQA